MHYLTHVFENDLLEKVSFVIKRGCKVISRFESYIYLNYMITKYQIGVDHKQPN
jgi:hypothetical protein